MKMWFVMLVAAADQLKVLNELIAQAMDHYGNVKGKVERKEMQRFLPRLMDKFFERLQAHEQALYGNKAVMMKHVKLTIQEQQIQNKAYSESMFQHQLSVLTLMRDEWKKQILETQVAIVEKAQNTLRQDQEDHEARTFYNGYDQLRTRFEAASNRVQDVAVEILGKFFEKIINETNFLDKKYTIQKLMPLLVRGQILLDASSDTSQLHVFKEEHLKESKALFWEVAQKFIKDNSSNDSKVLNFLLDIQKLHQEVLPESSANVAVEICFRGWEKAMKDGKVRKWFDFIMEGTGWLTVFLYHVKNREYPSLMDKKTVYHVPRLHYFLYKITQYSYYSSKGSLADGDESGSKVGADGIVRMTMGNPGVQKFFEAWWGKPISAQPQQGFLQQLLGAGDKFPEGIYWLFGTDKEVSFYRQTLAQVVGSEKCKKSQMNSFFEQLAGVLDADQGDDVFIDFFKLANVQRDWTIPVSRQIGSEEKRYEKVKYKMLYQGPKSMDPTFYARQRVQYSFLLTALQEVTRMSRLQIAGLYVKLLNNRNGPNESLERLRDKFSEANMQHLWITVAYALYDFNLLQFDGNTYSVANPNRERLDFLNRCVDTQAKDVLKFDMRSMAQPFLSGISRKNPSNVGAIRDIYQVVLKMVEEMAKLATIDHPEFIQEQMNKGPRVTLSVMMGRLYSLTLYTDASVYSALGWGDNSGRLKVAYPWASKLPFMQKDAVITWQSKPNPSSTSTAHILAISDTFKTNRFNLLIKRMMVWTGLTKEKPFNLWFDNSPFEVQHHKELDHLDSLSSVLKFWNDRDEWKLKENILWDDSKPSPKLKKYLNGDVYIGNMPDDGFPYKLDDNMLKMD